MPALTASHLNAAWGRPTRCGKLWAVGLAPVREASETATSDLLPSATLREMTSVSRWCEWAGRSRLGKPRRSFGAEFSAPQKSN